MRNLKNNRGITLISLIVYIILALIVLSILGLITSSFRSNVNNMNAQSTQDVVFDKLNAQLLKETKDDKNTINPKETNEAQVMFTNGNKYTYNEDAIYLNDNIKVADNIESCTFEIKTKKHIMSENTQYIDKNGDVAMIPAGFMVSGVESERTIQNGLVIYCGVPDSVISLTTTVTVMGVTRTTEYILANDGSIDWSDGASVAEAQKTYDQFVWIPVNDINDMYMCQSEGTDTDGSGTVEDDEYSSCNITVQEVDGEKVAYCTTHSSTLMAGRLYAKTWHDNYEPTLNTQTYNANNGLREPAVVTGDYSGTGTSADGSTSCLNQLNGILGTSYTTANSLLIDLQSEYNEIVKSVYQNKGFYVGRYETSKMISSNINVTVKIVAGSDNSTNSYISKVSWYRMYAQQKKYAEKKGLTASIGSTMIQGAAYDQVLKFIDPTTSFVTTTGRVAHDSIYFSDYPYKTGGLNYSSLYIGTDYRRL